MTSPIPSEPRTLRKLYHAPAPAAHAVWMTAGAVATIYALQVVIASFAPLLVAMALTYMVTIAGLVALAKRGPFSLGLRPAPLRFWISSILIGVACWYVSARLVSWVGPPGNPEHLETLVTQSVLVPSLVAIAVLPAIAEELVFRGLLARSFASRSVPLAIVGSSAVFSAYHVLPLQMLGVLPLGLALGTIAVRSDSVLPGMLAHFLNNATVILVSRDVLPSLDKMLGDHPSGALASAIAITGVGVALAAKGVA